MYRHEYRFALNAKNSQQGRKKRRDEGDLAFCGPLMSLTKQIIINPDASRNKFELLVLDNFTRANQRAERALAESR